MVGEYLEEKKWVCSVIKILLSVFKWLCLALCIINLGFLLSFIAMIIIKGNNLNPEALSRLMNVVSGYAESDILEYINSYNRGKLIVAGAGYCFGVSLTYGLIYYLLDNFSSLFKTVIDGKMFTKANLELINESLFVSVFIAFLLPIIIVCISISTSLFSAQGIDVSGLVFILVCYVLKLIFLKGYQLQSESDSYKKEINEYKATIGELKTELVKNSAVIVELQKNVEKAEEKVVKAKAKVASTKVEEVKVVKEDKKETKTATKKAPAKKRNYRPKKRTTATKKA